MAKSDDDFDSVFDGDDDYEFLNDDEEDGDDSYGLESDPTPPKRRGKQASDSYDEEDDEEDDFDVDTGDDTKERKRGIKKTAIIIILTGFIALVAIVLVLAVVQNAKNKKSSSSSSSGSSQTVTSEQISQSAAQQEAQQQQQAQQEQATQSTEIVSLNPDTQQQTQAVVQETQAAVQESVNTDPYEWIEITLSSEEADFGDTLIDSTFTVTDIKLYARKVGVNNNDMQLRGVVTGSISGLVGTYVLELPADITSKLSLGMNFTIQYQLKDLNGTKLVGQIKY